MEAEQQIMIVNWRWNVFKGGINEKIFREKNLDKYLGNITAPEHEKYYRELDVEYSSQCPHGKFVMTDIYADGEKTQQLFFALLAHYISPENKVLLFLHRGHFYDEADVSAIRKQFGKFDVKCFLVADGRDFIYYNTKRSGLLNESGDFFIQRDQETDEFIETYDEKTQTVKQPYFDRVWSYYQEEFQSKVFILKEELFDRWFELLLPDKEDRIEIDDLKELLHRKPERNLLFRIKSFLGYYKNRSIGKGNKDPEQSFLSTISLTKERLAVERQEETDGRSYLFDDAIENLAIEKERERPLLVEAYNDAKLLIEYILFGSETYTSKSELRQLAEKLNLLVQVTPGELSN